MRERTEERRDEAGGIAVVYELNESYVCQQPLMWRSSLFTVLRGIMMISKEKVESEGSEVEPGSREESQAIIFRFRRSRDSAGTQSARLPLLVKK